ncbi:SH3 domain-containing protein [Nonomuraea sp. C10]|uniref:SH3 domain-containing protein n=1 Tax=Nonomuraea sp. C10 TaxID=2600577 RepID=UPI0011CD7FAB|nr:SH3 domain-containing protein [Nonomuraea sp. C10]TXK35126.1 SH3 domain-containing protein [Nonomuraea sp. C10]
MIKQFTLIVASTLLVPFGAVPPAAAGPATADSAQQGTAVVCNKVKVTGSRVALREFAFTNAQVLRVVPRGTTLTSCGIEHPNGSGYTKCGRVGYDWHRVTTPAGRTAYVPATCVRAI